MPHRGGGAAGGDVVVVDHSWAAHRERHREACEAARWLLFAVLEPVLWLCSGAAVLWCAPSLARGEQQGLAGWVGLGGQEAGASAVEGGVLVMEAALSARGAAQLLLAACQAGLLSPALGCCAATWNRFLLGFAGVDVLLLLNATMSASGTLAQLLFLATRLAFVCYLLPPDWVVSVLRRASSKPKAA